MNEDLRRKIAIVLGSKGVWTLELEKEIISEIEKREPFTTEEEEVMNTVLLAHEEFLKLDRCHPMEIQEWTKAIHDLQSILIYRVVKRDYPKYFK